MLQTPHPPAPFPVRARNVALHGFTDGGGAGVGAGREDGACQISFLRLFSYFVRPLQKSRASLREMASPEERHLAMTTQFGRMFRWVLSRIAVRLDLELL